MSDEAAPSSNVREVVLASANRGKLRELEALLGGLGYHVVAQGGRGVAPVAESGRTFADNALLKARHAARHTGGVALADDSGLEVDALAGAPGVHSARYAGEGADDHANLSRLLAALEGVPSPGRGARFVCALAWVEGPEDPEPLLCEGRWEGAILHAPRGENGFGYDPVFLVPERGCSSAELAPEEKNAISHRARALRMLLERLRARARARA